MISASSTLQRSLLMRHKLDLQTGHSLELDQSRRGNTTQEDGEKGQTEDLTILRNKIVCELNKSINPILLVITILLKGTWKHKSYQATLHFTAALENIQVNSSLIESVSQICMFLCSRQQS